MELSREPLDPERCSLELCLRTIAPPEAQERQAELREAVADLVTDGRVGGATVTWWGRKTCAPAESDETDAPRCPAVVAELLAAAAAADVSLEPFVGAHPAAGADLPDVLSLPVAALLVRVDGAIRGVYPLRRGDQRVTVADGLAALAAGDPVTNLD